MKPCLAVFAWGSGVLHTHNLFGTEVRLKRLPACMGTLTESEHIRTREPLLVPEYNVVTRFFERIA
jgi:hypothetical protein